MSSGSGTSSAINANQNATINAGLALGSAQTWTVAAGRSLTVGGTVASGGFNLAVAGPGTLYLANSANSFTGGVSLNGGTLNFAHGTLGANAVNCNGGTLQWAAGNSDDISSALGVSAGTQTAWLDTNGNSVQLVSAIAGSGGLAKLGGGQLLLAGNNTYGGGTTINAGSVVSGARGLGSGQVNVGPGTALAVAQAGNIGLAGQYFNITANQANLANLSLLQASIGGTPSPLIVNTTSLDFGSGGSFPSPYNSGDPVFAAYYSGLLNLGSGGTYTFGTGSDNGSMLFIDGAAVVANNYSQGFTTRSGTASLAAGYHKIVVTYNNTGGTWGMIAQISGANNTTMANLGTSNANAQLTPDLVIGSLAGGGSVTLTTGNLITGTDNTSTTFSGTIAASGPAAGMVGLVKFGSGTLTLAGPNTCSGPTTLVNGSLATLLHQRLRRERQFRGRQRALAPRLCDGEQPVRPRGGDVLYGHGRRPRPLRVGKHDADPGRHRQLRFPGYGVVQHQEMTPASTSGTATLVLDGTGSYSFNGYLRNMNGVLGLTMSGPGVQTLGGGNISYTGPTNVAGGQLLLYAATSFQSPMTIGPGGRLSWSSSATMGTISAAATTALNSGGTLENINPANWTVLGGAVTVSGRDDHQPGEQCHRRLGRGLLPRRRPAGFRHGDDQRRPTRAAA